MVNRTLTDEIITINLENTTIPNIPYIGTPVIGNKCILVFIDGSTEQPYAIT